MFDIPPPIEQYCPQETIELIIEIKNNNINDFNQVDSLLNNYQWDSCLDSVIPFLFSIFNGSEDKNYIISLLNTRTEINRFTEKTKNIIYEKIDIIPYIDEAHYAKSYFRFLTALKIEPTEAIKNLSVSELYGNEGNPLWEKNHYLAYMGDLDAFSYLLTILKNEEDPNKMLEMSSSLQYIPRYMRKEIIETFKDDIRTIRTPYIEVENRMLIHILEINLRFGHPEFEQWEINNPKYSKY